MVKGKQLWATHYRFMNDKLEGSVLERAVWKLIESSELKDVDRALIGEMYRMFDGVAKFRMSQFLTGTDSYSAVPKVVTSDTVAQLCTRGSQLCCRNRP